MSEDVREFVTKTDVRNRGWNQRMIDTFLGEPVKIKPNPRYSGTAPMQLYRESRVLAVEQTREFLDIQQRRVRRCEGSAKGAATKRRKLQEFVDSVKINVPVFNRRDLIQRACQSYNSFKSCYGREYSPAHPSSDAAFLERISVNFLRHCMTKYESVLGHTSGKVGAAAAYCEIKHMALDAIATAYPFLFAECQRQKELVGHAA